MSITNSIQLTLNIKEKYVNFPERFASKCLIRGVVTLLYHTSLVPPTPSQCPLCGAMSENYSIIRNGSKTSSIVLPNISNFNTRLELKKQRFLCKSCSSTFTPDSSIVRKNCFISNNTRLSCMRDMKDKISIVDIAKRHAISHATVNQSLRQLNASFIIKKSYLPEHLSMDEFKSVKSSNAAMSFIFLNSESGEVLDIVEDRRLNNLIHYFLSYSRKARMSVKTVCIDMYSPICN